MKQIKHFTYLSAALFITAIFLFSNCTSEGADESPDDTFNIAGEYCLDFAIVGASMTIQESSNGYQVDIQDFDGGLRSATGLGNVTARGLEVTGTVSIESGTANYQLLLSIDEQNERLSGLFEAIGPQGEVFFNTTLNATKGACTFSLSPGDVDNIKGEPLLTDLHVELDKIEKLSRYRSAAGHNFVDYSGESCVNLKHYFLTYEEAQEPDPSELPSSLEYFSPANGTVVTMQQTRVSEDPTDYEIDIRLSANENVIVRVFHVNPKSGLTVGDELNSGESIGFAPTAHLNGGDFAVYVLTNQGYRHISMFEIMDNNILDRFIGRGVDQNWKTDLYYETTDDYPQQIFCENTDWGNLRHPASNWQLDYFVLDN